MKKFFLSFFLVTFYFIVWAHPHIWVESSLALVAKNISEGQLQVEWSFDPMFTGIICEDYDLDKNGALDEEETKKIEREAFSNLKNFDFYSYIFVDGKKTPVSYRDFEVELSEDKVLYSFKVPLGLPNKSNFTIQFTCYDPTIFTDLLLVDDPLVILPEGYTYTMSYQSYQILDEIEFPKIVKLEVKKR